MSLITQLALTSNIRATSCRDCPERTAHIMRSRKSCEQGLAIQAGLLPARRMNHDSRRLGIPSRFRLFGTRSNSAEGFDDFHGANFGGLSSTFRYLLIARGPGSPIGLQIAVEPEWSRVDDAGKLVTAFEAEARIIADTEI